MTACDDDNGDRNNDYEIMITNVILWEKKEQCRTPRGNLTSNFRWKLFQQLQKYMCLLTDPILVTILSYITAATLG